MQESLSIPFSTVALLETENIRKRIASSTTFPLVQGITLDPAISQDLDDAFWITQDGLGGYELQFSIANVASFLSPLETPALEQEAYRRVRTLYVADKAIRPLLPTVLSEDLLSLLEDSWRPALTLTIPLDSSAHPNDIRFEQTRIQNIRRFTYEEADEMLQGQPQTETETVLALAYAIAQTLRQSRKAAVAGPFPPKQYAASLIPHAFAVLVNQRLATFLAVRNVPALYRVHPYEELASAGTARAITRAFYDAAVGFHSRMGISGYLQSTSPLRRYGDLVNQRIVLAVLAGQESPYTQDELQQLAVYLNERERHLQEEERQAQAIERERFVLSFFEPLSGEAQANLTLEKLNAQDFQEVLLVMVGQPSLPASLEHEIVKRLQQGHLSPYDLFMCLFRSPHEQGWERVKRIGVAVLQQQPPLSMTLLSLGRQLVGWSEPAYQEQLEGPDNARLFHASAALRVAGQDYVSAIQTARQRALAKQLACLDLLARIAGVVENEFGQVPTTEGSGPQHSVSALPVGGDNPVSLLNELRQKGLLRAIAEYQYEEVGPPHDRFYTCGCSITLIDGQVREGHGSGKKKKDAARSAAEQVLKNMVRRFDEDGLGKAER